MLWFFSWSELASAVFCDVCQVFVVSPCWSMSCANFLAVALTTKFNFNKVHKDYQTKVSVARSSGTLKVAGRLFHVTLPNFGSLPGDSPVNLTFSIDFPPSTVFFPRSSETLRVSICCLTPGMCIYLR